MVNMVKNVVTGKPLATGGILSGVLGATLPTDSTTALDPSLSAIGYVSEEGLQETTNRDTERVKAWGGDVVKVLQTEHSVQWSYSMIEALRAQVNEEVYGEANVTTTAATASTGTLLVVAVNSEQLPHKARVFEIRDGDAKIRVVGPDTQIVSVGDITYADNDIVMYQVEVEAFNDAAGTKAYKYIDNGVFST